MARWARGGIAATMLIGCDRPQGDEPFDQPPPSGSVPAPVEQREVFLSEGFRLPPTVPAAEAGAAIGDDDEVIGVVAGGKARAYRMPAMRIPTRHIINDVVGGVAVSVTYCNLRQCVRGFGGIPGETPLELWQAGLLGDRMVVKVGGVSYLQETGKVVECDSGRPAVPFPYAEYPLVQTTWKEWKRRHPETDVYVGDHPPGDVSRR
jgi:hypothetical protein